MGKKTYTQEQMDYAIDKALHNGNARLNSLRGREDVLKGLIKTLSRELANVQSEILMIEQGATRLEDGSYLFEEWEVE